MSNNDWFFIYFCISNVTHNTDYYQEQNNNMLITQSTETA